MTSIIEINKFSEAVPRKDTWYKYYGDIFVSVMRESKPYIRRKAIPNDNKKDNELSEWHQIWQYEKIETSYGHERFGKRTYEQTIHYNGESHRIDSLVENVAIEFQHTLSVALEEMNSRYIAHSNSGFIPYLVLDLTDYYINEFESLDRNSNIGLSSIIKKWEKSYYCSNGKVFLNFKDGIVRINSWLESGYFRLSESHFIENLLNLETELKQLINEENDRKEQQKQIAIENRRKELEYEQKRREERKIQEQHNFRADTLNTPDFKYLKQCLNDPIIKPNVQQFENDVYDYFKDTEKTDEEVINYHKYYSETNKFEISYMTFGKLVPQEVYINGRPRIKKEYKYMYADIVLIHKFIRVGHFRRENNRTKKMNDEPLF